MPAIVMKKIATNPQQQQKKWRKRIIARSTIRSDDDVTDFVLQRWTFFSSEWNQIIWYIWYAVTLLVLCIALLTVLDGNRLKITFLFYFITIVKIMRSLRLLCHNWLILIRWTWRCGGGGFRVARLTNGNASMLNRCSHARLSHGYFLIV